MIKTGECQESMVSAWVELEKQGWLCPRDGGWVGMWVRNWDKVEKQKTRFLGCR